MSESVRTRFAPSPTGVLHVGGARTALFNWLFTRHQGGEFLLRIEDTDFDRSADAYVDQIREALKWLELHWDEGPGIGGPHSPYRQSQRLEIYREVTDTLKKEGKVYRCYCTPEELEEMRQRQRARGEPPRYSGRCRSLTEEERQEFEREGRDFTWRYKIPEEPVVVHDLVKGDVSFPADQVGDFIIIKSNGTPSYNFSCVVDDYRMNISHVIRGDDHLSNTPRQLYIYDALGWEPPRWCHLAMILGEDNQRLSKREGATDVDTYRKQGFLPEAMINALALLGWSPPDGVEVKTVDELIDSFDLDRVGRSPSRFDMDKFRYLNGQHLRDMDASEMKERLQPFLPDDMMQTDRTKILDIIEVLRDQLEVLTDFAVLYREFFQEPLEPRQEALRWLGEGEERLNVVRKFRNEIAPVERLDGDAVGDVISTTQERTGTSGRELYLPMRIAITGRMEGPEFHEMMPILGKQRCLDRIDSILRKSSETQHVES